MRTKLMVMAATAIAVIWSCGSDPKPADKAAIKRVVILGNSIVSHVADTSIGWYGNWGMAASARDSDFVHQLIGRIHGENQDVKIQFANIADFERAFDTYDLAQLGNFRDPDMLIIKLSENVDTAMAAQRDFVQHYDRLVRYLAPNEHTVKIVVAGFWPSGVNDMIRDYAIENGLPLVVIHDLYQDSSNTAQGLFEHSGVAMHPSDKGMEQIALRIWNVISGYFQP